MANNSFKENLKRKIPILALMSEEKRKRKARQNVERNFNIYKDSFFQFASAGTLDDNNPRFLRMKIVIGAHILEKGLSHTNYRPGFGKQAIIDLQAYIEKYLETEGCDSFAVQNAISLLNEYHRMNKEKGFDDSEYVNNELINSSEILQLSPYEISISEAKDEDISSFEFIASRRHSVRCYEQEGLPIDSLLLKQVITLANTAPSACNRQATHVFAVTDKTMIKQVQEIHGGCKGFGENVSAFLLITSDLSLYSSNEVKLPIYDAGIYTMNLLYALQAYGLYSCALNGSFPGDAMLKMHELTSIPLGFDINGMIAVYKLPNKTKVKIAASPRRSADDVLTVI